jgi:hypothetical protein
MRDELLKARGRLAEDRRRRGELSLEGKGLVILLREALDPFEPDLARLRTPEAGANMKRLVAIHAELRELDTRIDELADALGHADG